ncbi:hypothetical protein PTNB73_03323 [Pyrenophora teres f. teres]|uniref:Rifin STEVOR domain containing protein n=1 Tax=Pyrenophora teres f. teres TaxID=97479 RepID=A0A6S6WAK8_9PLEO|nr:hypothetical protein HRS9139_03042 [Pyrenophora teres f. teres]KAE8844625.1 hypothetical protein PTNB85_02890 [Pyrenophora teres f. teres]KAE8847175.1 hypothetical protein HRS9122_04082 [Pyrenophora teres f. teres]KAE8866228.1 hypothetical protein PTNB29_03375 [Pyrenophora teres f. teres]KAE8871864.1 hypothetical protein PTNB73_03323 [Pyrenophora teres f. teres]
MDSIMATVAGRGQLYPVGYNTLPGCAKRCEKLLTMEANCIAHSHKRPDQAELQDCVCHSGVAQDLQSGAICHDACSGEDEEIIRQRLTLACHSPEPIEVGLASSTSIISTTTTPTLSTTNTPSYYLTRSLPIGYMTPPALSTQTPPAPTVDNQLTFTAIDPTMLTMAAPGIPTATTILTVVGPTLVTVIVQPLPTTETQSLLTLATSSIPTMTASYLSTTATSLLTAIATSSLSAITTSSLSTTATSSLLITTTSSQSVIATSSFSKIAKSSLSIAVTSVLSITGMSSHSTIVTVSHQTTTTLTSAIKSAISITPTSTKTPEAETNSKIRNNWLHHAGMYSGIIVSAIVGIIVIVVVVLALRRRATRKKELERERDRLRPIRLQVFRQSGLRRSNNPVWPLMPPTPRQKFGETIRAYAADSRDNSTTFRPSRTLSQTEAMIRDRILETGRPDIPLSATPKIHR